MHSNTTHPLSRFTLAAAALSLALPITLNADTTQNGWSGGDAFNASGASGSDFMIDASQLRSLNFAADRLTNTEDRDGIAGADTAPYFTAFEVYHVDERTASNNAANVVGQFISYLKTSTRKQVSEVGLTASSIAEQPTSIYSNMGMSPLRSALFGFTAYVGCRDFSDETPPFPYESGLFSTLVGAGSIVELDADTTGYSPLVVSGDSVGIQVDLMNGEGSDGAHGVEAEKVIGLDVRMRTAEATGVSNNTEMDSFHGVRIHYPERRIGSGTATASVADFTAKSTGILLESSGAATTNGRKTGLVEANKYAGLRAEASVEIADRLVHDPIAIVQAEACLGDDFPIDRPVLYIKATEDVGVNRESVVCGTADAYLPNGLVGQRLTVFVTNQTVTFYDEDNVNLAASVRVLGNGDILELIFLANKWHEVSYSNN